MISSWEQNDKIGDKGGGVNIVLPDNKPKPITRNLDNENYKPIELHDYDKNDSITGRVFRPVIFVRRE